MNSGVGPGPGLGLRFGLGRGRWGDICGVVYYESALVFAIYSTTYAVASYSIYLPEVSYTLPYILRILM